MTKVLYASTQRNDVWLGPKRYVCIVIHDTHEEFVKAAKRTNPYAPKDFYENAAATFQPAVERHTYDKKTKRLVNTSPKHYAGVIRLNATDVTHEIIVHEVVHAAAEIYRTDIGKRVNLGASCNQSEEYFAYIVGGLSSSVIDVLTELKV